MKFFNRRPFARRSIRTFAMCAALVLTCGGVATAGDDLTPLHVKTVRSDVLSGSGSGSNGSGVTVAIIDTGVADVPALAGTVIHQQNISAAPATGDQYGHGTFVAGIVHQVAPGAKIVSIKLSGANGAVDVSQVLAALQWVAQNRDEYSIDVLNLSFGTDAKQSTRTSLLNYAVQRVWKAGIVVVASAGNLGNGAGTVTKPADDPLIISAGATNENYTARTSDDTIPNFVSRGPTQDGLAKPDLVAPGAKIISLRAPGSTIDTEHPEARVGTEGFRGSGTSFAAPLVAGVAAQLLGADPSLTPNEVKYALMSQSEPVSGDPAAQGAGSIDAMSSWSAVHSGSANSGVVESDGSGSINSDRGSAQVDVVATVDSLLGTTTALLAVTGDNTALLEDDVLSPLQTFNRQEYLSEEMWEASRWGASRWGETQWGASRWGETQWGASRWGASRWGSAEWWAEDWN